MHEIDASSQHEDIQQQPNADEFQADVNFFDLPTPSQLPISPIPFPDQLQSAGPPLTLQSTNDVLQGWLPKRTVEPPMGLAQDLGYGEDVFGWQYGDFESQGLDEMLSGIFTVSSSRPTLVMNGGPQVFRSRLPIPVTSLPFAKDLTIRKGIRECFRRLQFRRVHRRTLPCTGSPEPVRQQSCKRLRHRTRTPPLY